MKIKKADLDLLKSIVFERLNEVGGLDFVCDKYESGEFPNSESVKCLQTRFIFDVFHATTKKRIESGLDLSYLSDSHIKTALKSFLPKIEKKY